MSKPSNIVPGYGAEPVFTLRAQDTFAIPTLMHWYDLALAAGVDPAKLEGAMDVIRAMKAWQERFPPKLPD